MLCNVCNKNEATVHLTQIKDGKMQKVDLCEGCSKEQGVNDPHGFSLADLLLGLGAAHEMEKISPGTDLKCPHCGFTQADFKKAGRLGCSECYIVFGEALETLLKSMHKGTKHIGKVPLAFRETREVTEKLKHLQKKLEKAISDENFEQAAMLRDEINQLKPRHSGSLAS